MTALIAYLSTADELRDTFEAHYPQSSPVRQDQGAGLADQAKDRS